MTALVELARYSAFMNAEIAKSLLESHEIGAVTMDGGTSTAYGIGLLIPTRLMVLDEDYDAAYAVLKDAGLL
jgi:Putative prokaryotic signal transducing protein